MQLKRKAKIQKVRINRPQLLSAIKIDNTKHLDFTSSVIRQKSESQNCGYEKTKHPKFSEKRTFLTPKYAHVGLSISG